MKKKRIFLFFVFLLGITSGWGQTWKLTETLTATLRDSTLSINGTGDIPDNLELWNEASTRNRILTIEMESGITGIGAKAFAQCSNLVYANIANSVTNIGDSAFFQCSKLSFVNIPRALTRIGAFAFGSCYQLPSFTVPYDVNRIGEGAFAACRAIAYFEVDPLNEHYTVVDGVLYNKDKTLLLAYPVAKTDVVFTVPDGVEAIGESAFTTSGNLTEVKLPDNLRRIGNGAFAGCLSLTAINIPENVIMLGHDVFNSCWKLASINLGHVMAIGNGAFMWCRALTSVDLSSLRSLGDFAFFYCENLASIKITSLLVEIGVEAFGKCYGFTGFDVDANNPNYASENGVLYDKEQTTLLIYPAQKEAESFTVPSTITTIAAYAFNGSTINSVDLSNVKTIQHDAFLNSHLKSIDLTNIEGIIETATFSGSKELASVKIPETVTGIDSLAFAGCTALASVEVAAMTPYSLPANVFDEVDLSKATLSVPAGTKSLYQSADVWKEFGTISDGQTVSNEGVHENIHIYINAGSLYINSPSAETFEVYTTSGALICKGIKPAGYTVTALNTSEFILIVKGSSGWIRKVVTK
ncbi:MAG: leucine-rich repeat domain-containing protein [Tannerellaceae bacterium]|nr:leucine-rich repeat domain-containing protein [Tannerellaceae bacterium]